MMSIPRRIFRLVVLCAIGAIMAGVGLAGSSGPVAQQGGGLSQKPFVVFDATLYKDKPNLWTYNILPLSIVYEWRFWPDASSAQPLPAEEVVRKLAGEHRGVTQLLVIDIERWPLKGSAADVQSTVSRFSSVLSWVRNEIPGARIGLYGTVPLPDYFRAIRDPRSPEYRSWQRDNDRLEAIVSQVDALFPSIYTFYPDRQGWVTYANAQISEARRKANGKPVYAFLWPQYHESNLLLSHRPLDPDYWELQLKTVYDHADGVVIWGGWGDKGPESWDEAAPWWQATKRFLAAIPSRSLATD
jgi:Hyaluronidase